MGKKDEAAVVIEDLLKRFPEAAEKGQRRETPRTHQRPLGRRCVASLTQPQRGTPQPKRQMDGEGAKRAQGNSRATKIHYGHVEQVLRRV